MSAGDAPDAHLREIRDQPDAMRRAAGAMLEQRGAWARIAAAARERPRLVLSGMGSSFDACYPAVDHLAAWGIVVAHELASELLHFRRARLDGGTFVALVSQSGGSAEVVRLAEEIRRRPTAERSFVASITNGLDNDLAHAADVALDIRTGPETAPSSTTFVATLTHLAALARAVAGDDVQRAIDDAANAARATSDAVQRALSDERSIEERTVGVARGKRMVVVLGRGAARATAEMGALTLQECGVVAAGFEGGAFRHGPFELAGPGLGAIVVATEGSTRALDLGQADDLRATGSDVVVLTDDAAADGRDAIVLPVVEPLLSPAVSMVPIQLAARRLALDAGREPGTYVFARKITARE
jgi:glutamine---fructose-6-phosphate transaminase (isomerizing)